MWLLVVMFQQTYDFVLVQTFFQLVDVSQQGDCEHTTTQEQQSFNFINEVKSKILQPKVSISNKITLNLKYQQQEYQRNYMFKLENSLDIY
jgi:hypothetical protein